MAEVRVIHGPTRQRPRLGRSSHAGARRTTDPTLWQTARLTARLPLRFFQNAWREFFHEDRWNIGVVSAPAARFVDADFQPEIRWLPPLPGGRYAADPFAASVGGRCHLLFEEFCSRSNRGQISALEFTEEASLVHSAPAISAGVHLSYPFLLEHEGRLYCIPESQEAGEVAVYGLEESPHVWRRMATLLPDVAAVDSTVFFHAGRWWLFCTQADAVGDANVDLYIYHALDLFGPWQAHAGNPVKSDVGGARPAGTPFVRDRRLYRPAQDCSRTYGGRLVLHEVTALTPVDFAEQPVRFLEPHRRGPYPHGLHTLSGAGPLTFIDGKRRVLSLRPFFRVLAARFARMRRANVGSRPKADAPALSAVAAPTEHAGP